MSDYSTLFPKLTKAVEELITEVNSQNLNNMATDKWNVKDELSHIVFWHMYYAQNYAALAANKTPLVFTSQGGSTRNQKGVDSLKNKSKDELIKLLHLAQKSLYKSIVVKKIPQMNYTDHKVLQTKNFLIEVTKHIQRHTLLVRKAK